MITPILERLILTGRARKWNKVHGLSAAGRIKCPKDRWLVITDIWYYPFQDMTTFDPNASIMQLNLRASNGQEMQNYMFKNNYHFDAQVLGVDGTCIHMHVLDIFKADVSITLTKSTAYNGAAVDFVPLDPQAQQQLPPNGYGISTPVLKRSVDTAGTEIIPAGIENFTALLPTPRASEDYKIDTVLGVTNLLQPVNNQQIPVINFTVVEVNSADVQNN